MTTNTWDAKRTAGAFAVAAAVAGVGGTAIAAATHDGFHTVSGGMHGGGPPSPPAARRNDAEQTSLHGESVVADGRGGYQTLLTQTGRVTFISTSSVTARSDDGFQRTYVIREPEGAAAPPFHVGEQVSIDARREGGAAMVTTMRPSP